MGMEPNWWAWQAAFTSSTTVGIDIAATPVVLRPYLSLTLVNCAAHGIEQSRDVNDFRLTPW